MEAFSGPPGRVGWTETNVGALSDAHSHDTEADMNLDYDQLQEIKAALNDHVRELIFVRERGVIDLEGFSSPCVPDKVLSDFSVNELRCQCRAIAEIRKRAVEKVRLIEQVVELHETEERLRAALERIDATTRRGGEAGER